MAIYLLNIDFETIKIDAKYFSIDVPIYFAITFGSSRSFAWENSHENRLINAHFCGFSDMLERYINIKISVDGADHTWHLQWGKLLLIH